MIIAVFLALCVALLLVGLHGADQEERAEQRRRAEEAGRWS